MKIVLPSQDFSASPFGKGTINGMPSADLQALYYFNEAASGDAFSTAVGAIIDHSGKGNHATLHTGASAFGAGFGVRTSTTPNAGFVAKTPIPISGAFTAIVVVRNRNGNGPSSGYPTFWKNTAALFANMGGNQVATPGGRVGMNLQDGAGEAVPALIQLEVPGGQSGGPVSNYVSQIQPTLNKASGFALAFSVDPVAHRFRMKVVDDEMDITDTQVTTALYLGTTPKHAFGFTKQGAVGVYGEMGLAALYSHAADMDELDALLLAARNKMGALHGIAVV